MAESPVGVDGAVTSDEPVTVRFISNWSSTAFAIVKEQKTREIITALAIVFNKDIFLESCSRYGGRRSVRSSNLCV